MHVNSVLYNDAVLHVDTVLYNKAVLYDNAVLHGDVVLYDDAVTIFTAALVYKTMKIKRYILTISSRVVHLSDLNFFKTHLSQNPILIRFLG